MVNKVEYIKISYLQYEYTVAEICAGQK